MHKKATETEIFTQFNIEMFEEGVYDVYLERGEWTIISIEKNGIVLEEWKASETDIEKFFEII